ncbi:hypothetical protein F444_10110 [Phytophthora nicotianae P1976]|uniref:Uncharacterized protein n=1 Tax=Phytophthora nicotianae P1976 TaxID=1317066 RepID=A0A081A579_PHYNI|nr:hypothetical protein F444_10110 [Phytophthora nicotianae P1976]
MALNNQIEWTQRRKGSCWTTTATLHLTKRWLERQRLRPSNVSSTATDAQSLHRLRGAALAMAAALETKEPSANRSTVKKRNRTPRDQSTKKKATNRKADVSDRSGDSEPKFSTTIRDTSASLSRPSLPKPVPARKSVAAPYTAAQRTSQVRGRETDVFGRYDCRKSDSATKIPTSKAKSVSPSSASAVTENSLSPPSPLPEPRKKRRVFTYLDTDHVALVDLQAQERELAWIQSQHTQIQNTSRPTKPAAQKRKTCHETYMDGNSDANSVVYSVEPAESDYFQAQSKTKVNQPVAADRMPPPYSHETDTLASYCAILDNFGQPTQCISSVFPVEEAKPQSDVTRAVSFLVTAHLPIIRRCHRRKVQAILAEARWKIAAYQAALKTPKKGPRGKNEMRSHVLPHPTVEKHAVRQCKAAQHPCRGSVLFQIGRGDSFVRERIVSSLIQINRVEMTRSLWKYTASIGLRANYRVDDDPILRYTASTRRNGTDGGELAKKYRLQIGSVADEEVAEFVLRLVVGRLGDSEQVFHALKSELGFSQAYTAYSELKKLHDSRQ